MTTEITTCRIWGEEYEAVGYVSQDPSYAEVRESARAGGGYITPGSVRQVLRSLDEREKARLTTWLVDQRLQGNSRPTVTEEIIEYAANRSSLPIYERADRLLRFMSEQTELAGEPIDLGQYSPRSEVPSNSISLGAMAWSESTSPSEISYLAEYLNEEGWVEELNRTSSFGRTHLGEYRITVRGHSRIAEQAVGSDPSQVFVAMWFDDSVREAYEDGIEPAILDPSYISFVQ